jgi:hypothetical protein
MMIFQKTIVVNRMRVAFLEFAQPKLFFRVGSLAKKKPCVIFSYSMLSQNYSLANPEFKIMLSQNYPLRQVLISEYVD